MKQLHIIPTIFFVLVILSCSKDDDGQTPVAPLSSAKQITQFRFLVADNTVLAEDITGTINETAKTIAVTVPHGTDVANLTANLSISDAATVSPTETQNFAEPVAYTITAQDGSTTSYLVTVTIKPVLLTGIQIREMLLSYTYDENYQLISFEGFERGGIVDIPVTRNPNGTIAGIRGITYTYDSNKKPVRIDDGSGHGPTILEYDDAGKPVRQHTLNNTMPGGPFNEIKNFIYDSNARLTQVDITTSSPVSISYTRVFIYYNTQGNIRELVLSQSNDGVTYSLVERRNYVYDDKINPFKKITNEQLGLADYYIDTSLRYLYSTAEIKSFAKYPLRWISNNNVLREEIISTLGTSASIYTYTYNRFDLPVSIEQRGVLISGGETPPIHSTLTYNL